MFGYGRGFGGWGRGRSGGRGLGRGFRRGFGPGRGACYNYYITHGTWPVWSRRAGGPGYGRYVVAQNVDPNAWPAWTAPADAPDVEQLRQEVQQLQTEIDEALQRLSEMNA